MTYIPNLLKLRKDRQVKQHERQKAIEAELTGILYSARARSWNYYGTYRGVSIVLTEDHIKRITALLEPECPK